MDDTQIKYFVEAALLAAGRPLSIDQIQNLFDDDSKPEKPEIRQAIGNLIEDYKDRGVTVAEVASGFRMQVESGMVERLHKLWEERPPRYSRALFETMALIAYRQPMTRGEIEEIRGVTVSSNIVRTLLERQWIHVVGHRDVPGRPAMFGTTKEFLDYFNLKKLDDLPPLADLSDWESLRVQLNLPAVEGDERFDEDPQAAELMNLPSVAGPDNEDSGDKDSHPPDLPDLDDETVDQDTEAAYDADPQQPMAPEEGFEPLQATRWPAPAGQAVAVDAANSEEQSDIGDVADDEDSDASMTGA